MWITLKNIKIKWRYKARSRMTPEELVYFNAYVLKHREETLRLEGILIKQNLNCSKWIIVSPMFLPLRRKETPDKKVSLNFNIMKTWDFITYNNNKIAYKELMKPFVEWICLSDKIEIEYKIFYWKNKPDGMNITSATSKFFLDLLVEEEYIKDDDVDHVISEKWIPWWKDIWNERIEITITNL